MNKGIVGLFSLWLVGCAVQQPGSKVPETEDDLRTLQISASQNYIDKQWAESYRQYLQLVESTAAESESWFRLGVSAYRLGKLKESEYYFEQVVRNEPRHRKALFNLTLLSLEKGTRYLDQYLRVTPPEQRQPALVNIRDELQQLGW